MLGGEREHDDGRRLRDLDAPASVVGFPVEEFRTDKRHANIH
jgi:hypothetical protein